MKKLVAGLLLLVSSAAWADKEDKRAEEFMALTAPDRAAYQDCLVGKTVELGRGNGTNLDDLFAAARQACGGLFQGRMVGATFRVWKHVDMEFADLMERQVSREARPKAALALAEARK